MRFHLAGLSSSRWVVPVCYQARVTRYSAPLLQETRLKLLQATNVDASETQKTGRWPWVFKTPGRCVDLPSEEVFSGFDGFEGLLLDEDEDEDDVSETESEDARAYSKVSREVRNAYHTFVSLDTAPTPELIILSKVAAALTGIPIEIVQAASRKHKEDDALLQQVGLCLTGTALEVFGGVKPSPYSSSYGGHQFGNWAGQLGDGRVCTLGEIETAQGAEGMGNGSLLEVQLKGIGQTPFSRGGDGKAVLGACLREFLFSEAFLGLGLPAAIAVSVCLTGEDATIRDTDPKNSGALKRARGAVLCRAAPSFLRFGSFELPARRGDVELVRNLADYCVRHLGSCLDPQRSLDDRYVEGERKGPKGHPVPPRKGQEEEVTMREKEDYLGLLVAIVEATARMVAGWQAVGFCHGVLNTDNFTLLGLALDFGPCSFMGRYDPCWSPNDGDSALRYSFQNQPDVAAWNCERLAEAFSSIIGVSGVARANEVFSPAFDAAYTASLEHKFGLCGMKLGSGWMHPSRSRGVAAGVTTEDAQFVLDFFRLMSSCRMDFTDTWRALLDVPTLSAARKTEQFSGAPNVHSRSDDGTELGGGRRCANGTQEEAIYGDDQEALRPLLSVLKAAGAASEQMREWAAWVREYSSRIDTQGIGKSHPDGKGDGRAARLEMMRKSSPAFVLREESLDQALKAAEMGDMSLVRRLEERLSRAYETD